MAYTLEKDSEFAIDSFDILDSERKLGLSGHMRVKNEAHTLRLSIVELYRGTRRAHTSGPAKR